MNIPIIAAHRLGKKQRRAMVALQNACVCGVDMCYGPKKSTPLSV